MPRILRLALCAVAVGALAPAAGAHAQTPTAMTATILSIGSRDSLSPPTPLTTSMNLAECQTDAPVVIRVNNVLPTATELDFWAGAGCQDATMRSSTTSTTCNCLNLGVATSGATMVDVNTTVGKLLGIGTAFRATPTTTRTCTNIGLDGDSAFPVIVIGVTMAPCSTETAVSYGTVSNGSATFTVDTTPPGPPTAMTAGTGDTAIPVSWMPPGTGLAMGGGYDLFVDTGGLGGDAGGCGSGILIGGGAAPSTTPYKTDVVALSTTIDGSALGLPIGGSAAVATVAVDKARNVSPLSNVVCIQRIMSTGFWNHYTAGGGTASSCSVGAPGSGGAAGTTLAALALVGLGIALRVRGRR